MPQQGRYWLPRHDMAGPTQHGRLAVDDNDKFVMGGTSSSDNSTIINSAYDPTTRRLLVDVSGGGGSTIYNDTVSGTIDGVNTVFTVPSSITYCIALFLSGSPYQEGVDYTFSGTTITMTIAPDATLSGLPFWLAHT